MFVCQPNSNLSYIRFTASFLECYMLENLPCVSVEPDIFLGNFNQLLVNVNTNHASGLVVLRNAEEIKIC